MPLKLMRRPKLRDGLQFLSIRDGLVPPRLLSRPAQCNFMVTEPSGYFNPLMVWRHALQYPDSTQQSSSRGLPEYMGHVKMPEVLCQAASGSWNEARPYNTGMAIRPNHLDWWRHRVQGWHHGIWSNNGVSRPCDKTIVKLSPQNWW